MTPLDAAYIAYRDTDAVGHRRSLEAACHAYVTALALDPETVERVAKKLLERHPIYWNTQFSGPESQPWSHLYDQHKKPLLDDARAALSTLTAKE